MYKKITINSKDYKLDKVIDFNAICELEDLGLSLGEIRTTKMSSMRALFAFVANLSLEEAGAEIMEHLKNGGTVADLTELLDYFIESDFFRATRQPSETEETPTSKGTV